MLYYIYFYVYTQTWEGVWACLSDNWHWHRSATEGAGVSLESNKHPITIFRRCARETLQSDISIGRTTSDHWKVPPQRFQAWRTIFFYLGASNSKDSLRDGFSWKHLSQYRGILFNKYYMAGALAHRMWGFVRSQSTYSNIRLAGVGIQHDLGGFLSFSTVGEDPDTHHDFKPVNKPADDILSAHQLVEKDIKENPVMLYMKGVPDAPRCGFSASAVKVLQSYGVPFSARNILEDKELKESIKSFSNWPTFPQVFIKGEFVGGCDIILSMHQSGELKEKLKDRVQENAEGKA